MKQILKYGFITISLMVMITSCKKPLSGSDTPTGTTVRFVPNFLGIYQDNNQPGKSMEIEIIVDNLDGNLNPISNFSTMFVTRSNVASTNNYTFNDVQVPDSGSWAITAVVRGIGCYTGCGSGSQLCSEFDSGRPFFREVVTRVNQSNGPSSITMFPAFVNCQ